MAEDEENKKEEENQPKQVKKTGKNSLLALLLFLNMIVVLGIGFMQYSIFKKQSEEISLKDIIESDIRNPAGSIENETLDGMAKKEEGILFPLESFTANLAQGDGARRFVRMVAVLKFSTDSSEEEFQARIPQIRDTVINTLNSKRPEDILKVEGKTFLKEEIKSSINSFLIDGRVLDVFYVSFQVN